MSEDRENALRALIGQPVMVRSVHEVFYCFGVLTGVDPDDQAIIVQPPRRGEVRYVARLVKVAPIGEFV